MSENLHPEYLLEFNGDIQGFYCDNAAAYDHVYIIFYPSGLILDIYTYVRSSSIKYIPETNSIHGPSQSTAVLTMTWLSPVPKTYEFFNSEDQLSFIIKKSDWTETPESSELYPFYTCNCTHTFYEPTGDWKIGGPSGIGSYGCAKLLFIDHQLWEYRDSTTIIGAQTEEQVQLYPIYKESESSPIYLLNKIDLPAGTYNFLTSYGALLQFENLDRSRYSFFKDRYTTEKSTVTSGDTDSETTERTDLIRNKIDSSLLKIEQHPRYGSIKNQGIIYDRLCKEKDGYRDKDVWLLSTDTIKYSRTKPYVLYDNKTSVYALKTIHSTPFVFKIDENFIWIVTTLPEHFVYRIPSKWTIGIFRREPHYTSHRFFLTARNLPDSEFPKDKRKVATATFKGNDWCSGQPNILTRLATSMSPNVDPIPKFLAGVYNGSTSYDDDPLHLGTNISGLYQYVYGNFTTIIGDIASLTTLQGDLVDWDNDEYGFNTEVRDYDFLDNPPKTHYWLRNWSISNITGKAEIDSSLDSLWEWRKKIVDDHIFKDNTGKDYTYGIRYAIKEQNYPANNITQLYIPHHYILLYYPALSWDTTASKDIFKISSKTLKNINPDPQTANINGAEKHWYNHGTSGTLEYGVYNFIQGKSGYWDHRNFLDVVFNIKTAQSGIAISEGKQTLISDANFQSRDYGSDVGNKTLDYSIYKDNYWYLSSHFHLTQGISLSNQITNNYNDIRWIVTMFDPELND